MKTYKVLVTAFASLIVSAEDAEEAQKIASENIGYTGGFEVDDYEVRRELTTAKQIADHIKDSEFHKNDCQKTPYTS